MAHQPAVCKLTSGWAATLHFSFRNALDLPRPITAGRPSFRTYSTKQTHQQTAHKVGGKNTHEYESPDPEASWVRLAHTYGRLSAGTLQQLAEQPRSKAHRHAELSRAITQAAGGRFFDLRRGRSDWEALSAEFNLSMAECLQLFDSSQSPIEARNMPCAHKWTNEDRRALCTLVGDTFGHMTADSWRLADTYMNTQQTVCFTAHGFWKKPHLTAGIYAEFHMLRGSGLKWKEIREQYAPYYRNDTSIASAFYQHKSKHPSLGSSAAAAAAAMSAWQAADRARIRELIWHHRDSIDADSLMQIASAEFPDKPAASTAKLCCNLLSEAKCKPLGQDALRQLQLLVNGHGEDWPRIGAEMQMFPERAQNNWVKYGKADEYVGGWSGDELEKLQYCIARDMAPSEAARYIGTKLPKQCWYKMRRIQRAGHL